MKKLVFKICIILIISILLCGCRKINQGEDKLYGPYEVIRVVDGDTLLVNIDNTNEKVRLIGIDTPESVHSDPNKNTEEGNIASAWSKTLLMDQQIYLEYDVEKTDKYGRILAYVYLEDGITMVNRLLVEQGMAQVMTIEPNSKYSDEFNDLQNKAKGSNNGFWASYFEREEK